jgi:hypothetical protein
VKNRLDDPKGASRRRFTKAAVVALAAAPLACAQQSGQGQSDNRPPAAAGGTPRGAGTAAVVTEPTEHKCCEEIEGGSQGGGRVRILTDHAPPTLFGDSLHLEIDQRLKNLPDNAAQNRPPKRQVAITNAAHQYRDIARLYVVTEFKDYPRLRYYDFPQGFGAQLQLWLRDAKSNPDQGFDPVNQNDRPEVIISGDYDDAGVKTLLIESNKHLGHVKKTAKGHRRQRHEHKHNNRDFRISKWQIVRPDGTPVAGFGDDSAASGAQKYTFMIVCYQQ